MSESVYTSKSTWLTAGMLALCRALQQAAVIQATAYRHLTSTAAADTGKHVHMLCERQEQRHVTMCFCVVLQSQTTKCLLVNGIIYLGR
jgi:hypothetical protein